MLLTLGACAFAAIGCNANADASAWNGSRTMEIDSAEVTVSPDHEVLYLSLEDASVIPFNRVGADARTAGIEDYDDGFGDTISVRVTDDAAAMSYLVHPVERKNPRLANLADSVSLVARGVTVVTSLM
jgi:hypothetical protein